MLFQFCSKDDDPAVIMPGGGSHPNAIFNTSCEPVGDGVVYEVGPGKTYERIVDVPFEDLKPGAVVKIYAKGEPYYERVILSNVKGTVFAYNNTFILKGYYPSQDSKALWRVLWT